LEGRFGINFAKEKKALVEAVAPLVYF